MNITDIEKYAWFSNLAYVKWDADNSSTQAKMAKTAIEAKRAPETFEGSESSGNGLATKIFKKENWSVIPNGFVENDSAGFAVSLYTNDVEKVLAIRGTEPGWIDLAEASLTITGDHTPIEFYNDKHGPDAHWHYDDLGNVVVDLATNEPRSDKLFGSSGNDRIQGFEGQDRINGGDGSDILEGGGDIDVVIRGAGNDEIYGGDQINLSARMIGDRPTIFA